MQSGNYEIKLPVEERVAAILRGEGFAVLCKSGAVFTCRGEDTVSYVEERAHREFQSEMVTYCAIRQL